MGKALRVNRGKPGLAVVVAMSAVKALRVNRQRPGLVVGVAMRKGKDALTDKGEEA